MRYLALILSSFLLAACGFSPVYSTQAAPNAIAVDDIPGRSGHELRKALLQELAPGLPNVDSAVLNIDLDEDLRRLALRPDDAAARTDFRATARYVLVLGEETISGNVRTETTFAVPDAPYADIASQIDSAERAMRKLAREIVDDIRLQLADKN